MHTLTAYTFLLLALLSVPAIAADVKCKSTIDVEYYMQQNLPDKAIECLNKLIDQDPANPRLQLPKFHLLKGEYCLKEGNTSCAKERFRIDAVKQKYGKQIAVLYKKEGDAKINAGSSQQADMFYSEAMSYDPSLKAEITNTVFHLGKQTGINDYFLLSTKYNPSLKPAVADHYYSLSMASHDIESRTDLLGKAADFDNARYGSQFTKNKEKIGRSYLNKAIQFARQPGKEAESEGSRKLARKYLGDPIVDRELPEKKYFGEGMHDLGKYEAGEQTPFWLACAPGSFNAFIITTNGNRRFTVVTSTNERFDFWDDKQRKDYLSQTWGPYVSIKIHFHEAMECMYKVTKK